MVSLAGMLHRHVASGVGIDLVGEGRNVVKMKDGAGGDGGGAPTISVQQVRFVLDILRLMYFFSVANTHSHR